MNMYKKVVGFFDVLEDRIRSRLSEKPILYAIIASIGTVLLWRGIWMMADSYSVSGPISAVLGTIILLLIGVFVSGFIGNRILLAGMRNEKKLTEKTKQDIDADIEMEKRVFKDIKHSLEHIEEEIKDIRDTKK